MLTAGDWLLVAASAAVAVLLAVAVVAVIERWKR